HPHPPQNLLRPRQGQTPHRSRPGQRQSRQARRHRQTRYRTRHPPGDLTEGLSSFPPYPKIIPTMLLTIKASHRPATDLGYLLQLNPAPGQTFATSSGSAYVFFLPVGPEKVGPATQMGVFERC